MPDLTTTAPPLDAPVEAGKSKPADPAPAPAPEPARVPVHMAPPGGNAAPTVRAMVGGLMRQVRASGQLDAHALRGMIEQTEDRAVRAALADLTRAELPPQGTWVSELDNFMREGMPVVNAFTVRPTDRFPVKQRQVKTAPTPAKQANEKTAIASTPVEFEWAAIPDFTWAHGDDVSVQAIEDNGEQIIEDLIEVTGEFVGRLIDADALAVLDAAATAGTTTGITLDTIGGAIGTIAGTGRAGSGISIVCAPDVYGTVWALTASGGPSLDRFVGLTERPTVVASPDVAAGAAYVGARSAFRTYLASLARLRAVEVSLLGVNIGVYRRGAFRVVDAGAIVKLT